MIYCHNITSENVVVYYLTGVLRVNYNRTSLICILSCVRVFIYLSAWLFICNLKCQQLPYTGNIIEAYAFNSKRGSTVRYIVNHTGRSSPMWGIYSELESGLQYRNEILTRRFLAVYISIRLWQGLPCRLVVAWIVQASTALITIRWQSLNALGLAALWSKSCWIP